MKLTKRILSFVMAALMLFSGMAISASAAFTKYTLSASNCYVDKENGVIFVEKATVSVDSENYDIVYTATQKDDATKTLKAAKDDDGNTLFLNPTTGKTYIVKGTVTIDGISEDATNVFSVTMLKSQSAPAAPVPKKITSTSIEINAVSGCEYRIVINGDEKFGSKTTFTGLKPGTYYTFEMRYAETSVYYASPVSTANIKTLALADSDVPHQPIFVDKTNKTITVAANPLDDTSKTIQFSIDDGKTWQETGHFTGLSADKTYAVIARYKFDASTQEPNSACEPIEIRTNARDTYPANINNCKFSASDGKNYANQPISISVTADLPEKHTDTQFGDTKYIPAYFTVDSSEHKNVFSSSDGKKFTAEFTPGEAKANKKIAINVYYSKMKCIGEESNGDAKWIAVGEMESKTYYVQVGETHTFFTNIKDFFLQIFNFLFNELPAKINDLIKDFDLSGFLAGLGDIFKILGDMGEEAGGGAAGGDLGGLLGGLVTQ